MAFPTKRIIKKRRGSAHSRPADPVASAYAPPAIKGEVIDRRPARNRKHPHPSTGDYYRVQTAPSPTLPKQTAPVEPKGTAAHQKALQQTLAEMPTEFRRSEDEIYSELVEQGQRGAFAALSAHREMAATILAAGGTRKEAADYAGITEATVSRFFEDQEFRARVSEVRSITLGRVQGRIVKDLERRTEPKKLKKMELVDVLRIYDRTAGPKSGAGKVAESITVNNYDAIFAEITRPDSPEEGEDFPGYGTEVIPLPGGGSQVIRKVPRSEVGSPRR